jgi:hypothetical protein
MPVGSTGALAASDLPRRRWTAASHAKLGRFLAAYTYAGAGREGHPFALFDADNTLWSGDLGDSALVFLATRLGLSPRLHEVLPEAIDVPAEGFGVAGGGRLFPAARVRTALEAMAAAYRRNVSPSASVSELQGAFSPALIQPGGPLHGDAVFQGAYRVYVGTLLALYNLLEAQIGCLAHDPGDARPVTALFSESVHDFYREQARSAGGGGGGAFARPAATGGSEIVFPAILDTGPDQRALRARAALGAYSQIAVWEALDHTPEELGRLALRVWDESPAVDTPFPAVFPVDAPGATAPAPLDLGACVDRPGERPSPGVVLGATAMLHGVRIREEIVDLAAAMARRGIAPVVVTASQADLVRAVVDRHYGLGGQPLAGMRCALEGGRYGAELKAPATYRTGKVDAARAVALSLTGSEETRPVLCAGDTNTDLEMLAYSGDYRLFFDRGKRPLMDLCRHLIAHGGGASTVVEPPFG